MYICSIFLYFFKCFNMSICRWDVKYIRDIALRARADEGNVGLYNEPEDIGI